MNQQNTLDFYANLLIQCDDIATSEDRSPGRRDSVGQIQGAKQSADILTGWDQHSTSQLIADVRSEFRSLENNAKLACSWLSRQKFGEYQNVDAECDSIMHALLTADAAFDKSRCYAWYEKMQYFSDCLLLSHSNLCTEVLMGVKLEDVVVIEHISIVAFEASLQALKMWSLKPVCAQWHAAGDIIVLIALALRKIPGQKEFFELPIEVSESARARVYHFLLALHKSDPMMQEKIQKEIEMLQFAQELTQPLMESMEDLRLGLHLLIRLFNENLRDDVIFEFILPLLTRQDQPLIIEPWEFRTEHLSHKKNKVVSIVSSALGCVEDSWCKRLESFQSAEKIVNAYLSEEAYLDLSELTKLLSTLASWLVKELETDSTWVNLQRGKCRKIACELCSQVILTISAPTAQLLDNDVCVRMITLLARTWVVDNTQPAGGGSSISPNLGRRKNVDRDDPENDSQVLLELLGALRNVCGKRQGRACAKMSPADLLDDILNQLVCGLLRMSTFGLPIFLEEPYDDLSRKALSDRRKTAQMYYAANTGVVRSDELAAYLEVYRNFNEHIENYVPAVKTVLKSLIELSGDQDHTIYSKLLSYVSSEKGQALVFEGLSNALLASVSRGRISWFYDMIGRKKPPSPQCLPLLGNNGDHSLEKDLKNLHHLIRAIEMGLDTNPDYRPEPNTTETVADYIKALKRLGIDLVSSPEGLGFKAQYDELSRMSVGLFGSIWLSRLAQDALEETAFIRASCVLCLACDWLEEDFVPKDSVKPAEYEDLATSSIAAQETSDYGSDSSLKDFLDLQFRDNYRQSEGGEGLLECQLRPDLYHYIKNTFWDDRMAER